jgi:hypothetical protein
MNILVSCQKRKNLIKSQNEFQWTTIHFFGMFISYKCDLHLKLDILNPLNIISLSNGLKNESFALQPFLSKFQDFEETI